MDIIIEKISGGYRASIDENPKITTKEKTVTEAIGNLILKYRKSFGIRIWRKKIKKSKTVK